MFECRKRQAKHKCEYREDAFDSIAMGNAKKIWLKFICIYEGNPGIYKYVRSSSALYFEKRQHITSKGWYIIHPFSLCRTMWEYFLMVIFTLAAMENGYFMTWRENMYFIYSTDILKIICILNIFMTFLSGYTDVESGEIVMHQGKIIENYTKSYIFYFELIAAFPWTSLFVHYVITEEALEENTLLNMLSWTSFFTIVYIIILLKYSTNFMLYFPIGLREYRTCRLILMAIFLFHWLTCIQCNDFQSVFGFAETRLTKVNLIKRYRNMSNLETYWKCYFRTTCLLTKLSYETIYSEYWADLIPDMMCLIIGYIFFYYCLEQLLLLSRNRSCPETKYKIQMELLNEFMRRKEMPDLLQERIRSLYEYRFQKKYFEEDTILSTLSPRLRQEIVMHSCRHLVQDSLLFRNVPRSIMSLIISNLKHDIFLPHEVLIKAGSFGDCMFFLTTGTVAIITRTGNEMAHLKDGSFFGELALVTEDERRVSSVIAIEFCEVYRLERVDFQRVIRPFRELYGEIQRVAWERLRQTLAVEGAYRRLARHTPEFLRMLS